LEKLLDFYHFFFESFFWFIEGVRLLSILFIKKMGGGLRGGLLPWDLIMERGHIRGHCDLLRELAKGRFFEKTLSPPPPGMNSSF
jgi:hypothetical protein